MAMLIVKSQIKAAIPDMNVSGELAEALNKKVTELLKAAAERAKANKRKTVMAYDL